MFEGLKSLTEPKYEYTSFRYTERHDYEGGEPSGAGDAMQVGDEPHARYFHFKDSINSHGLEGWELTSTSVCTLYNKIDEKGDGYIDTEHTVWLRRSSRHENFGVGTGNQP